MNQSDSMFPATMPDIARGSFSAPRLAIDWVGMSDIPQQLQVADGEACFDVLARTQMFVDLQDARARGIHMSRLYLLMKELLSEPLTPALMKHFCEAMLKSQADLSSAALLKFSFDVPLVRPALLSDNSGWGAYPVKIQATHAKDQSVLEVGAQVLYSSTCPCSSALARQIIQNQFVEAFGAQGTVDADAVCEWLGTEQGVSAVPHSQRSKAEVKVRLAGEAEHFGIVPLLNLMEETLKTPVQAAVKREDEQEFARLNGQHAMFCEDAARYLKAALSAQSGYQDFHICVRHMESLHAHDAVAVATKGVTGGYLPDIS